MAGIAKVCGDQGAGPGSATPGVPQTSHFIFSASNSPARKETFLSTSHEGNSALD